MNDMSKTNAAVMRTPLGRVRGLGSAKSGTHHWWMQRVTSIALLPLTLWTLQVRLRLRDFVLTDRGLVFDSKVCPPPSLQ